MIQPITLLNNNTNDVSNDEKQIYMINNSNNTSTRGTLVEVHISDIHFGALDPKYQYNILKEQFLNKISTIHFDILCIDGDLYNHKYMSNSDVTMYASLFVADCVNICREKGATFIIIHGTLLHDDNQLKLFYHYMEDPSVDVRIVEQVKFEYVKGARILCIPELYNMGKEYYEKFLFNSGYYDSVFMHGEIDKAIYRGQTVEPSLDGPKSPIFTINDFCLCLGPIISGHIHTSGCFDKYFYYCGSPLRWQFGEEQPKGFLIVLHNLDTQYHYTHLETIESYRYDTIKIDDLLSEDPKNVIDYVNNLLNQGIEFIRLEYTKSFDDNSESKLELLRNYYQKYNNVKFKIKEQKQQELLKKDEEVLNKYDEYKYILDSSLSEYEILSRYINQQEGYEIISAKELEEILKEAI